MYVKNLTFIILNTQDTKTKKITKFKPFCTIVDILTHCKVFASCLDQNMMVLNQESMNCTVLLTFAAKKGILQLNQYLIFDTVLSYHQLHHL